MSKKHKAIFVDPSFARRIKTEAAMRDISVIKYSQFLADEPETLDSQFKKAKKEKRRFNFGI